MIDFSATVLGPCMAAFGEPVRFLPAQGVPVPLVAVFDDAYREVNFDGAELPIATTRPMLGCRAVDFPHAPPAPADLFQVRGQVWQVVEVHPDGRGHLKLFLLATG